MTTSRYVLALLMLPACGRLRFEPLRDAATSLDASPAVRDATVGEAATDAALDGAVDGAREASTLGDAASTCAPGFTGPQCSECVRYVDGANTSALQDGLSWQSASDDIIRGLVLATNAVSPTERCQVWVREGRYFAYVDSPVNTIPLAPNVLLYGGFAGDESSLAQRDLTAHVSIIDGRDPLRTMRVWHPLVSSSGGYIDGFTVTGGSANGAPPHGDGGGMMISGGTVRMANMIFQDNVTRGMGGAIHVVNASLIADDCQFLDNQADGSGGAIAVGGTNPGLVLRDVDLRGNVSGGEGGGLYVTSSSAGASVSLQNVVIAQNTAGGRGGAAALRDVDCTIVAATVAANQAGSGAGAIDVANTSACALINSIAWNPSTLPELSGLTNVDHCLVRGDNLASQPSFASYPADLHLTATSPALDAAKACAGPALDRDGAPRVDIPGAPNTSAAASDIGAYELQTGGSATQPFDVLCP